MSASESSGGGLYPALWVLVALVVVSLIAVIYVQHDIKSHSGFIRETVKCETCQHEHDHWRKP